jgi:uncharacterized protein (TIGR03086 family)
MSADLLTCHAAAGDLLAQTVQGVTHREQGRRATPCDGWRVDDLISHLIGLELGFLHCFRSGRETSHWRDVRLQDVSDARHLLPVLLQATHAALRETPPGAGVLVPSIDATHPIPYELAAAAHVLDVTVHAWDLAVALGMDVDVPDRLTAACSEYMRLVPDDDTRLSSDTLFAPAQVEEGAGEGSWASVLAFLGRSPSWPEPAAARGE